MAVRSERYAYHPPVAAASPNARYELAVRGREDSIERLDPLGALGEIRKAVLGYYSAHRDAPLYRPQLLKKGLEKVAPGWIREPRVPPYDKKHDNTSINERYDALKFFPTEDGEVGVAIEMDNWMVHRDLLKFRRGLHRGQIELGVIIQPDYYNLYYCYEHFLPLNGALFERLPIVFCCPRGPGLNEPKVRKPRHVGGFVFPKRQSN